jgi:hypothetical protein
VSGPPPVGLGDLLRAFGRLAPEDDATRAAIGRLLGFERVPAGAPAVETARIPLDEPRAQERRAPERPRAEAPPAAPAGPGDTGVSPAPGPSGDPLVIRLLDEAGEGGGAPAVQLAAPAGVAALPRPPAGDAGEPVPELDPLFAPRWVRTLVSAALAVPRPEGAVEIDRVVERIARRLPVTRLPRRPTPTLRMGVQVLVDRCKGMEPFQHDAEELIERIRAVVGESSTAVLRFDGDPRVAGTGPKRRWGAYRPPAAGSPVLVLSDFGLAGADPFDGDPVETWLDFAAMTRRARCPLIAFVPFPERRWPVALAGRMALVEWDRTATVTAARRAAQKGGARP